MPTTKGSLDRLYGLIDQLEEDSNNLLIPSIAREDGTLLAATAFAACTSVNGILVDAGAGIGFSTAWIVLGAVGSGRRCRVVAIEYDGRLFKHLRSTADQLAAYVDIDAINDNALTVVEGLNNIALLFVDIEKHQYAEILRLARDRLVSGGYAVFHNIFFPRPTEDFFQVMEELGWKRVAVPSEAGGSIILRKP
ncbi:MAG: class I SAM-dependent methyltransferase [Desulfurococcales archaeon]|nr:class I SAM-dependent methyltransferase [Desulfurococcales archaeon]